VLKEVVSSDKDTKLREREGKLKNFLDSLFPLSRTKQDVMDRVTNFLAEYLDLPAVYVGVVRSQGETESINYWSANPGQEHCVGKRILRQSEDSEEILARAGLSFDVFKVPEMPELEEEEEPVEGEEPKPRPLPKPSPLYIENVMRNPRIKFFGIPKLGAYVAIPLQYESLDHEGGCHLEVNEDTGEGKYVPKSIPTKLIIGMDTIGRYRRFTVCILAFCSPHLISRTPRSRLRNVSARRWSVPSEWWKSGCTRTTSSVSTPSNHCCRRSLSHSRDSNQAKKKVAP
jgi:hypothetical protein